LSQGPSSGIVDKTFVELMIVLLFTAFIIYVVIETYNEEQSKAISESIISSIEVDYSQCQLNRDGMRTVLVPEYSKEGVLLQNFYFKTREFDSLTNVRPADQQCIEAICIGLIKSLYEHRELISRVDIEGYASPGHTGRFSRLGRSCRSSRECNVIFSNDRAANIYQMCSGSLNFESPDLVDWFQRTFFPIGRGVPQSPERFHNIEFNIEYNVIVPQPSD
jgi:hypothetical protein